MGEMALDAALANPYRDDERVCEQVADHCVDINMLWAALPHENVIIPEQGAWVIVKEPPTTAIPDPPLYSMWRARPVYYSATLKGVVAGGRRRTLKWPLLRARIRTPYGELTLLPGEYQVIQDFPKWMALVGDGVTLNVMGPGSPGDTDFEQRVFYLRTRGLTRLMAMELLLPDVADQEFAWLSLDGTGAEEYIEGARHE